MEIVKGEKEESLKMLRNGEATAEGKKVLQPECVCYYVF
jgi:hypothetical protein